MINLIQWFLATEQTQEREARSTATLIHPDDKMLARTPRLVPKGGRLCLLAGNISNLSSAHSKERPLARLRDLYSYHLQDGIPDQAIQSAIRQFRRDAHGSEQAAVKVRSSGLSLAFAVVDGSQASVTCLGATRAYLWREGNLSLLTAAGEVVDERNPSVEHVRLQARDRLVLCTEAVAQAVGEDSLCTMAGGTPERTAAKIVGLARAQGATGPLDAAIGYYGPLRPNIRRSMTDEVVAWVKQVPTTWLVGALALVLLLCVIGSVLVGFAGGKEPQTTSAPTTITTPTIVALNALTPPSTPPTLTQTMPLSPTLSPVPAPTFTPSPDARPMTVQHAEMPFPRVVVQQLSEQSRLSEQEKTVYDDCLALIEENPERAGFLLSRAEISPDPLNYAFTRESGANELAGIQPGEKMRSTCFQTALMPVAVGVDDLPVSRTYPFAAGNIYLVTYTEALLPVFASSEVRATETVQQAEQQAAATCPYQHTMSDADALVIFSAQPGAVFETIDEMTPEGVPYRFTLDGRAARCFAISSNVQRLRLAGDGGGEIPIELEPGQWYMVRQ